MHLIICLDSSNANISEYFQKYPALYRNMEMLYIRTMSTETLNMLPKKYMEALNEMSISTQSPKEKVPVSTYFSEVLDTLLGGNQSPLRFYQLIKSYYHIYCNMSREINKRLEKLQVSMKIKLKSEIFLGNCGVSMK